MSAQNITMEDFISNFHSLHGSTVGERRKNLFQLLKETEQSKCDELEFSMLCPRSPLEEKFKVETLIFFRKTHDLMEVLKSENPILIDIFLKASSSFLEEAFENINGEQLVTLVLSHISFNAKVKLLNKLALQLQSSQVADEYFEAIEAKYGLYLATKLLTACSAELITRVAKIAMITPRQLLIIIKKHPALTESLLKDLKNRIAITDYKSVFIYVAQTNTPLFLKLYTEYDLSLQLGWRITSKFIQMNKAEVIKNPKKYYKLLHNKQIAKSLKGDFRQLYMNLFPQSLKQLKVTNSYEEVFTILKNLPASVKDVNILLTTFQEVYGCELWSHSEFISLDLLSMLSTKEREIRTKQDYRPSTIPEEKWNCYLITSMSIPYLKKAISLTSDIKARAELIGLLVETCKINEDKVALADMCNYITNRHRNDHLSVRLGFLNKIRKCFKLEELEEQHWTPINELIKIFALNDEQFFHLTDFLQGHIHFCLKNDLPINERLTLWAKERYVYELFNIIQEVPEYEKTCLLTLGELIRESPKDEVLNSRHCQFLASLVDWNKRHPRDEISLSLFPFAIDTFTRQLKSKELYVYHLTLLLKYIFCSKVDSELEQRAEIVNIYISKEETSNEDSDIFHWLVKHDPLCLSSHIDIVIGRLLKLHLPVTNCMFWRHSKYLTHLEIPQNILRICLKSFKEKQDDEDNNDIHKNIIAALSHLMSNEEFKTFILPYQSNLRRKTKSEEDQQVFKIQKHIGASLRYLNPQSVSLESILMFCKGNYWRLIQNSLYSVCGNVNEEKLEAFISKLYNGVIPIRKHSLNLAFLFLRKQHVHLFLNKVIQTEKNASVRKSIFKKFFKYFVRYPQEDSWHWLKSNVSMIDAINDEQTVDMLIETQKVPLKYFAQYIPLIWGVLEQHDEEHKLESKQAILLSALGTHVIDLLPKEFCRGVINTYLFKAKDNIMTYFQSQVQTFTCRCIIHCESESEQEERLELSFDILKQYIELTWNSPDNEAGARNCVSNFIMEFCLIFLKHQYTDPKLLMKFSDLWNGLLKPQDAFEDYLHLQFTLICTQNLPMSDIGQNVAKLCNSLASVYGGVILKIFCKALNLLSKYLLNGDNFEENKYTLIDSLSGPNSTMFCLVATILLLNGYQPTSPMTEEKHKAIVEKLRQQSDPIVQLHLHSYFKSTSVTNN